MDLFQHRYYRLTKIMMTLIGQWPYQSPRVRRCCLAVLILFTTIQLIPQVLGLVKYRDNSVIFLECIITFLLQAVCFTKLFGFMWNSQKARTLLNRIRTDWQVWALYREVNILHKFAEQGEKVIIMYTVVMYSTAFIFLTGPILTNIIKVFLTNGTSLETFPYPVDYYHLNVQKYYPYIIMYSCVCFLMLVMITVANEVMLIIYVQHVCSLFAALGYKLESLGDNKTQAQKGESQFQLEKRDMLHLVMCIDRHNEAIEYANFIEAAYRWTFFIILGFGTIMVNITGLQILLRSNDPQSMIKFTVYALAIGFHFYVECYIAQRLMDHSSSVGFYIQSSQWYKLSPKVRKILGLMTLRCSIPCQLTAGNVLILSIRTFGVTFRTVMSYFTFARSML